MATYTYLACDLRTNAILAELPLQVDGDITSKLNGYGSLDATLNLNARGMDRLDLPTILKGGRTALYVDRDGVLGWGGIVWSGTRTQADHTVRVHAEEFESYLTKRFIRANYKPTSVDQLTIARTLVNTMQALPGGDIGIQVGTETSGVLRSRDYFATDLMTVAEALRALTASDQGFDLQIIAAYDSTGAPAKYLRLGYPRLGRPAVTSGFDFQSPGNITAWTDDWDAFGDSATDAYVLGQGEGSGVTIAHASRPAAIDQGFPILDSKDSTSRNISQADELNAVARENLLAAPIPVQTFSCEVRADADPMFGSYLPGDEARFRLYDDDWWRGGSDGTPGLDLYLRLLAFGLNPSTDRVKLTLGAAR